MSQNHVYDRTLLVPVGGLVAESTKEVEQRGTS